MPGPGVNFMKPNGFVAAASITSHTSTFSRSHTCAISFASAMLIMRKVARALNQDRKAVNGSRILVLGVAYKKDIDDMRESPALDVIRLLEERGGEVEYHDPFVPKFREEGHEVSGVPLTAEALSRADAVVIVTDHSTVDYQFVVDHAQLVIDTRNTTAGTQPSKARIVPLSKLGEGATEGELAHT